MTTINDAGLALIKSFEGCELSTYKDGGGINTIGYGHVGPEAATGATISQEQADSLLEQDLAHFCTGVDSLVINRHISANQFSAMVAFAFNVGLGNFKQSTLLRWVNLGNAEGAADEFLRWNRDAGKVVAGLTRRREAERALFKS